MLRKYFATLAMLTLAAGAGCDVEEEAHDAGPSPEEEVQALVPILTIPFSETGFVEFFDLGDAYGVAVSGTIGVDDPATYADLVLTGFEGLYQQHFPEKDVPAFVLEVSEQTRERALLSLEQDFEPPEEGSGWQTRSQTSFCNAACKNFKPPPTNNNNHAWTPQSCAYNSNWHAICTYGTIDAPLDGSFVWNETPYSAKHTRSNLTTVYNVVPYKWQWGYWGGTAQNQYACLTLNGSSTFGRVGITSHRYVGIPWYTLPTPSCPF